MKINTSSIANSPSYLKTISSSPQDKSFEQKLKAALGEKDDARLYAACQEMESVFLSKVLQAMRSTIPRSGLIDYSLALDTFEGMLFDEYAKKISQSKSTGLADLLYEQLKKR
ncbi:flagellar protein FlgJ [Thermosyntropha lipolytica DSM 11003]|uniref:Flagellar protein FlgJ n=1 Tax=Thermosyntropha lipolytica DSM 11003 TaxID=1123382 RepID=A0A1M5K7P6_9FIRM|nr:rod-binding protein [Thermosyntropha lipolytica]SHG48814.1 flagellar protein FlgJ [Thermosyntropha lipolytica DSM 11003]